MVFVFKDFTRPPSHINTIPVENLDGVKDWLDSVDIPYSEGPLNLNWTQIMKTITTDPHHFFKEGGWSFLAASDSEDEEDEEEESQFEMSESEMGDEESSEEDSEFDEEASAEASEEGSDMSDEEGEDWDEMERKAARKDRESGLMDEDDEKPKSKGKACGGGGGGGGAKRKR